MLGALRAEVDLLAGLYLVMDRGETGQIPNGGDEYEPGAVLQGRGIGPVPFLPASHEQTLVRGRR